MTVRTNDIALLDLFEESFEAHLTSKPRDASDLVGACAVIEFHREPIERPTAVEAWPETERSE